MMLTVIIIVSVLAIGVLAGCRFIKPLDGPGMEREVNDSLQSETPDSVVAEVEGEPSVNHTPCHPPKPLYISVSRQVYVV
ncbi:MAG: hypothetical protein J5502_05555 [Prevotella sp.]|nr:hypothetical protein [Prevotella sp.]